MILFFISLLLIVISSYLILSVISSKLPIGNCYGLAGIISLFLLMFAQVVLSFEILSIFRMISQFGVILINLIVFIFSFIIWIKKSRPFFKVECSTDFSLINRAIKKDKMLGFFSICFLFFLGVSFYLAMICAVNSFDALSYHIARSVFWVSNGALSHFDIADIRNLVMPINSEILYSWVILFFKKDVAVGMFSFVSFLGVIAILYNILGLLKFPTKKKLWAVLILSSFASVAAEASGTETDLMLGALVLSTIYLFWVGVKEENKVCIYFSSLAYALSVGVKTPAVIALPGLVFVLGSILYFYKRENWKIIIKDFVIFFLINFALFACYNYVLNLLQFGNPLGSESSLVYHSMDAGFRGFVATFIRHFFLLFDFSGLVYSKIFGPSILLFQNTLITALNIPLDAGVIESGKSLSNNSLLDVYMGVGILGVLLFIPSLFISVFKGIKSKFVRDKILASFGLAFFVNLVFLSASIGFMVYSVRFITFFVILASPVLVLSYIKSNKNIYKWLVAFFVFSYFVVIIPNLQGRPFWILTALKKQGYSYSQIQEKMRCSNTKEFDGNSEVCTAVRLLEEKPKNKKVLLFVNSIFKSYNVALLKLKGWDIDFELLEDYENIDIKKYDYIITNQNTQESSLIKDYSSRKSGYSVGKDDINFFKEYKSQCVYLDRKLDILTQNSTLKPAYVACYVPANDFEKNGFKLTNVVKMKNDKSKFKTNSILLFENMSNQQQ